MPNIFKYNAFVPFSFRCNPSTNSNVCPLISVTGLLLLLLLLLRLEDPEAVGGPGYSHSGSDKADHRGGRLSFPEFARIGANPNSLQGQPSSTRSWSTTIVFHALASTTQEAEVVPGDCKSR